MSVSHLKVVHKATREPAQIPNDLREIINNLGSAARSSGISNNDWSDGIEVDKHITAMHGDVSDLWQVMKRDPDTLHVLNEEFYASEAHIGSLMIRLLRFAAEHQMDVGGFIQEALS